MKLRKPCEAHGRYDRHPYVLPHGDGRTVWGPLWCPGGVFLPDDTLVIEKVDGEWPEGALRAMGTGFSADILDALSVREAE